MAGVTLRWANTELTLAIIIAVTNAIWNKIFTLIKLIGTFNEAFNPGGYSACSVQVLHKFTLETH